MSKVIKAIFDSPDFADNAVAEIKRSNMNVQAYKPSHVESHESDDTGFVIPAMSTEASVYGVTPASVIPAGAAFNISTAFTEPGEEDKRAISDTLSDEVIASLTVEDAQAERVQAALVSLGGRQVRIDS